MFVLARPSGHNETFPFHSAAPRPSSLAAKRRFYSPRISRARLAHPDYALHAARGAHVLHMLIMGHEGGGRGEE